MIITLELPPQIEEAYLSEAQARGLPLNEVVREILIARWPKAVLFVSPDDVASLREQYDTLRQSIKAQEHGFLDAKAIEAQIAERKGFRG